MKISSLNRKYGVLLVLLLVLQLVVSGLTSAIIVRADSPAFADPAFANAWQQLDGPVAAGKVQRPYLWGTPGTTLRESYTFSQTSGTRLVQYFPKGRMELTNPQADPTSPGFVGDGRLVRELVTGQLQVGTNRFLQYDGAEIPVSGDKSLARNPGAPTYRAWGSLFAARASAVGRPVRNVLVAPEGEGLLLGFRSLNLDNALGSLSKFAVYFSQTGHNVPDVFWDYLNQSDASGEKLFNWADLFGLPLTDAYWTKVRQNGQPQDILVQLYERRTLLYNPALPTNYQVYAGDVGSDYYNWRYSQPELPVYDSTVVPSVNAIVQPAIGESGTTFRLIGSGFIPNETTSAWLDEEGGQFPQLVRVNSQGGFLLRLRTLPVFNPTLKIRLVVIGNTSGYKAVFNLSITNVLRYTPAVEAAQPTTVPPGINGQVSNGVIRVGGSTTVAANGFAPGEPLAGWITTPLNRVVPYQSLIFSGGVTGDYPFRLVADSKGSYNNDIPAPGSAEPGIYAFTLQGSQSGAQAIVYFRVRAGSIETYDPIWGFSILGGASLKPTTDLSQLKLPPPMYQLEQEN